MNNKIILSIATFALALTSSAIDAARCCSHSIENKSGKFINTVEFSGPTGSIRKEHNIGNGQKREFRTDQGGTAITSVRVAIDRGPNQQSETTVGNWKGNSNWEINPDLTVR
jgi:hypothetical protein